MVLLWDKPQEDVISERLRKFRDARVAIEKAVTYLLINRRQKLAKEMSNSSFRHVNSLSVV